MPEEEARLLAALTESHWVSLAAHSALTNPVTLVFYNSDFYRKLVGADAAASRAVRRGTARPAGLSHETNARRWSSRSASRITSRRKNAGGSASAKNTVS
jgi:hypothetical protein